MINQYQKTQRYLAKNIENMNVKDLETLIELNYEKLHEPNDNIRALIFRMSCGELLNRINDGCHSVTAKRIRFE